MGQARTMVWAALAALALVAGCDETTQRPKVDSQVDDAAQHDGDTPSDGPGPADGKPADGPAPADSAPVTDGPPPADGKPPPDSQTPPDTATPADTKPPPDSKPPVDSKPPDTAPPPDSKPWPDSMPWPDATPWPDSAVVPDAPSSACSIPAEAQPESVASPTTVVGSGTPASCTSAAFVSAVANGGIITFDCGPAPVTITLTQTAKIFNDKGPKIVIDGGGKVTLSGGGNVRILYQNTCDQAQKWTTSHCNDQDHPQLTVQNLTFIKGNAKGESPDGGGAIFVRGGRFKVINCKFHNNECDDVGPDVGGAAIRVLDQYQDLPVYVVQSTFGGAAGLGNICSNGGGLSSIGVSYTVINSLFSHNKAIGNGANPAKPGTPGGGSGGAIYNDGNTFTLSLCGVQIHDNSANEGGGAIFFVSNNLTGTLKIENSTLYSNPSGQFETPGYPGIFYLGNGPPQVINSTLSP